MSCKHIFFDLDGTLTDPEEGITSSVAYALAAFGIESNRRELRKFIGPPLLEAFMEYYGFSRNDAGLAVKKFREYFTEYGIFQNRLYPEIPTLLSRLGELGIRSYIATSKPEVFAKKIVEHFELGSYLSGIFGSELDGSRTRKGEVIRYALEQTGLSSNEVIMVGDREHDVIGAAENGLKCIGVLYGHASDGELERVGASCLISNPLQLLEVI